MLPKPLRFPLRKEGLLFKKTGKKFYTNLFTVVYKGNPKTKTSRFAFVVGKKISKLAVVRNRLRRQMSFFVKEKMCLLKNNKDILFIPKPNIVNEEQAVLQAEIEKILNGLNY